MILNDCINSVSYVESFNIISCMYFYLRLLHRVMNSVILTRLETLKIISLLHLTLDDQLSFPDG